MVSGLADGNKSGGGSGCMVRESGFWFKEGVGVMLLMVEVWASAEGWASDDDFVWWLLWRLKSRGDEIIRGLDISSGGGVVLLER
ncbi:hypothetical protein Tco_1194798 [Tanacetum coccineum]